MNRPSEAEHLKWLTEKYPNEGIAAARTRFSSASSVALAQLAESPFWIAVLDAIPEWEDAYFRDTGGFHLFTTTEKPSLVRKSAESMLDKVYRKNVIGNKNWPDPPTGGWITQDNWYETMSDIIRTVFIVKYLDGVAFVAERLSQLAENMQLPFSSDLEAREEGYYAAHCQVQHEVEIPRPNWDSTKVSLRVELQVTTQLQDAIRKLTHENYVNRRSLEPTGEKWQWDHTHPDFTPNYLGHILHYVEGMIMEVRDRRKAGA